MASDVTMYLKKDYLKTDAIWLEVKDLENIEQEEIEPYDHEEESSDLMISVHKATGKVLLIILEGFTDATDLAVKMLREYPLPWTFSVPEMKIKEKPLEDVILSIWKKHKNIKKQWE